MKLHQSLEREEHNHSLTHSAASSSIMASQTRLPEVELQVNSISDLVPLSKQTMNAKLNEGQTPGQKELISVAQQHGHRAYRMPSTIDDQLANIEVGLLQLSEVSKNSPAHISVDLITSLLNSTINIRQDIALLRTSLEPILESEQRFLSENKRLRSDIQELREVTGRKFTYFSRLPSELRLRIWKTFLGFQQIVCIGDFQT